MKQAVLLGISAVLIAFVPACNEDEMEPMDHKIEEFDEALNALETLVSAHGTTVMAAADLGAISTEELTFGTNAGSDIEDLHHEAEEMGDCSHDGTMADPSALETEVGDLETELAAHTAAMSQAADVTAATMEETRFQAAIATMISECDAAAVALGAATADYTCPGHHD